MRNAFIKSALRHVKQTLNRYIAIMAIVMLGVGFFAGVRATGPDMRATGEQYFNDVHFMDYDLVSTVGFNSDDLSAVRSVKNVSGVMPAYTADVLAKISGDSINIKLHSLDLNGLSHPDADIINRPTLVSGRMPKAKNECLVDHRLFSKTNKKIGDRITLQSGNDQSLGGTLNTTTFTIVGEVKSPIYIAYDRGTSTIGNGSVDAFVYAPTQAFSLPVYTDLYVTVKNSKKISRFDSDYEDLLKPVTDALTASGKSRAQVRFAQIKTDAQTQIDDAQKQVDDAEAKLNDAKAKLDDAAAQIASGERQLEEGTKEYNRGIAAAEKQLSDAQAKYDAGFKTLSDQQAAYDSGYAKYQAGLSEYNQNLAQQGLSGKSLTDLQGMAAALQAQMNSLPTNSPLYAQLAAQIAGLNTLISAGQQLDATGVQLASAKAGLDSGWQSLNASKAQLDSGREQLEEQKKSGAEQLAASRAKLDKAEADLNAGKTQYDQQSAEAQPKIDDAKKKISDGKEQLEALKEPSWYVLDIFSNAGFNGYKQDSERMDAIGAVFPLIFFVVAALVSLTTMTRLVDDDRMHIGTLKALGYGRAQIGAKYLLYALSASLLGSVIGLVVGFRLFPGVIYQAYTIMYSTPPVIISFNIPLAVESTVAAVLSATLPAYVVCLQSLHSAPAMLMQPKAPTSGRRILLERLTPVWKRLNFSQKVTIRNLFRYKKRLLMTVIGVAGCTGLMFTGFGLRDAVNAIVDKQFNEIRLYQLQVEVKDNATDAQLSALADKTKSLKGVKTVLPFRQQTVDALKNGKARSVYLTVPAKKEQIGSFITLRGRTDGKTYSLDDSSVVITEKLASLNGYHVGDQITLRNSDGAQQSVKISAIAENYVYNYAFMSPALYQKLFGAAPVYNELLVNASAGSEDSISKPLLQDKNVSFVVKTSAIKENFHKIVTAMDAVVVVLILSAAVLAFVVLYSLISINIDERGRELATLKVLGFYDRELAFYIYRENILLTVIGTAFGLLLGLVMEQFVVVTSEVDFVMFGRQVEPMSYVFSALLTLVFAAIVNAVMMVRFKQVDMVSSLKSNE